MFIGHFAVGLASKRLAPRTSLGALILAPLFLDALWPLFLAMGIESVRIDPGNTAFTPLDLHDYPWSHSLAMSVVWSVLAGVGWLLASRDRRAALVIGALVFSHWILDFVCHRPDMPLWPGSATSVGLGLWNSVPATLVVESLMYIAGAALYLRGTRARDKTGRFACWAFLGVVAVLYVVATQGPPPPSANAVMIGALFGWLFVPWAIWFDRHRDVA